MACTSISLISVVLTFMIRLAWHLPVFPMVKLLPAPHQLPKYCVRSTLKGCWRGGLPGRPPGQARTVLSLEEFRAWFQALRFSILEQEVLRLHFALDPAHYAAGSGRWNHCKLFFPLGILATVTEASILSQWQSRVHK